MLKFNDCCQKHNNCQYEERHGIHYYYYIHSYKNVQTQTGKPKKENKQQWQHCKLQLQRQGHKGSTTQ